MRSPRAHLALRASILGVCAASAACDAGGLALTVRVQTGLRAEREVRYAEVAYLAGAHDCDDVTRDFEGRAIVIADQAALGGGSFTVREIEDLAVGVYTVRARLRRPSATGGADSGAELVSRCVVVSLASDRVLRIPLTSDCLAVECPAPMGSPAFDQCLNGRCVDPRCDPDDPATADFCCDRALLGDACDTDPTLCGAGDACEPSVACAGTPRCEEGVCVEPVDDLCADDAWCSSETGTCVGEVMADAGTIDAALSSIDSGAIDAGTIDAGTIDAGAIDSGPLPVDAPLAPDATFDVGIDAFVSDGGDTTERDCTDGIDGDTDGALDCEDSECSAEPTCALVRCDPTMTRLDPSAQSIPTPILWWRSDTNDSTRAFGLCGWRDGIRGLAAHSSSEGRAPTLTGAGGIGLTITFEPGDVLTATDATALPPTAARTIFVLARHLSGGFTRAFVTGPTAPTGTAVGLRHDDTGYAYEGGGLLGLASGGLASGFASEILVLPAGHGPSTARLWIDGVERTLTPSGTARSPGSPTRHWIGAPDATGTIEIADIIVYDRTLDASERAMLDAYAARRRVGG